MLIYNKKELEDYIIFKIKSDFIMGEISSLLDDYSSLIQSGKDDYNFIFDLTETDIVDSSGLGTILMGASYVMNKGKKIKVCFDVNNEPVKDLFNSVNLGSVIEYYESLEDALKNRNKVEI